MPSSAYLARAAADGAPRVLVIQEWWGLNGQLRSVCDRFAAAGITAMAPDLYRGEVAEHHEMDKAAGLMAALPPEQAAADLGTALSDLRHLDGADRPVGVVGFCMGGMLSWMLACTHPNEIGAVVPYYGAPLDPATEPDWSALLAPVEGHVAEKDEWFPLAAMAALEERLTAMGKDVRLHRYPGTGHAFANEEDGLGTYDAGAADLAWNRTLGFLRARLA